MIVLSVVAAICLLAVLAAAVYRELRTRHQMRRMPPLASGAVPLLGHLPLLAKTAALGGCEVPELFMEMTRKNKDGVASVHVGGRPMVLIGDPARLMASQKSTICTGRFEDELGQIVSTGFSNLVGSKGKGWALRRRIFATKMLSATAVRRIEPVVMEELARTLVSFKQQLQQAAAAGQPSPAINIRDGFDFMNTNIILSLCLGRTASENGPMPVNKRQLQYMKNEIFKLYKTPRLWDAFPVLKPLFRSEVNHCQKVVDDMDALIRPVVRHRRATMDFSAEPMDFLDTMLLAEKEHPEYITEDSILSMFRTDLLIAGIETTSTVQEWIMTLLLTHPHVMARLQEEIDSVAADSNSPIYMDDIMRMPYLRAVVKETFRLRHPLPLGVPRTPLEDYQITDDYVVPKGTLMVPIFESFYSNPDVYPEPTAFRPERFMPGGCNEAFGVDLSSAGKDGDVIPFGAGPRMCVGFRLARMEIYLVLANLLHAFKVEKHPDKPVSMAAKLVVVCAPEVSPEPQLTARPALAVFEKLVADAKSSPLILPPDVEESSKASEDDSDKENADLQEQGRSAEVAGTTTSPVLFSRSMDEDSLNRSPNRVVRQRLVGVCPHKPGMTTQACPNAAAVAAQ